MKEIFELIKYDKDLILYRNEILVNTFNNYLLFFSLFNKILIFKFKLNFYPTKLSISDEKLYIVERDRYHILNLETLTFSETPIISNNDIITLNHFEPYTIVSTLNSLQVYLHEILIQQLDFDTTPHLFSLNPARNILALSFLNSSTIHLFHLSGQSCSKLQLLPHLECVRSIKWRDNDLLIIETVDNDLYAYATCSSDPIKFEPWTIFVSPSLLRSYWLGPNITDLILRRALSDSNQLLRSHSTLSSLIAERIYERVSQISQFSRDLILNFSSDGLSLSVNAILDTTNNSSNYIRSQPIVQLSLNNKIPNDINEIEIVCQDFDHSPIYFLASRLNSNPVLVGILNPSSMFDPLPDTKVHPPISFINNLNHYQHYESIDKVFTNANGSSLITYSKNESKYIVWKVISSPSNGMHKLSVIESSNEFQNCNSVQNCLNVNDSKLKYLKFLIIINSYLFENFPF